MSLDIASTIFWKFSACCSAREENSISVSLLTPSTSAETVRPKRRVSWKRVVGVSSITSWSSAAIKPSLSMRMSARMEATAMGWEI